PHGQQAEKQHKHQSAVHGPEGNPEHSGLPAVFYCQSLQDEEHQPYGQHTEHTEQCSVAVQRCCLEALHIVKCNGRIDKEAEQAGTNQVPEADRDNEIYWPSVSLDPGRCAAELQVMVSLEAHEHQRYHLQCAECCSQCNDCRRSTRKIKVME